MYSLRLQYRLHALMCHPPEAPDHRCLPPINRVHIGYRRLISDSQIRLNSEAGEWVKPQTYGLHICRRVFVSGRVGSIVAYFLTCK
jgi:hypothetical protein